MWGRKRIWEGEVLGGGRGGVDCKRGNEHNERVRQWQNNKAPLYCNWWVMGGVIRKTVPTRAGGKVRGYLTMLTLASPPDRRIVCALPGMAVSRYWDLSPDMYRGRDASRAMAESSELIRPDRQAYTSGICDGNLAVSAGLSATKTNGKRG